MILFWGFGFPAILLPSTSFAPVAIIVAAVLPIGTVIAVVLIHKHARLVLDKEGIHEYDVFNQSGKTILWTDAHYMVVPARIGFDGQSLTVVARDGRRISFGKYSMYKEIVTAIKRTCPGIETTSKYRLR